VRPDGAGASFAGRISAGNAAGAAVVAGSIAVAATGVHGLELAGIAAAGVAALGVLFARWLAGMTGDTLGATAELTETLALVAAAGLTGSG
jgi:adenosylcobinamide-GDP ribazoletransferase